MFSERRADVRFDVGDEIIPAHSLVLESRSDYFRSMFAADMAEAHMGMVKVEGHPPVAFRALLSYLYTEEVGVEPELLPAVMMLAGQYLAKDLHGTALRMALHCLGMHNAVSWLITAHVNPEHLAGLKAPALQCLVECYDECMAACDGEGGVQRLVVHPELNLELTQALVAQNKVLRKRLRECLEAS